MVCVWFAVRCEVVPSYYWSLIKYLVGRVVIGYYDCVVCCGVLFLFACGFSDLPASFRLVVDWFGAGWFGGFRICFCVAMIVSCGLTLPVDGATLYGCYAVYLIWSSSVRGLVCWLWCFVAWLARLAALVWVVSCV